MTVESRYAARRALLLGAGVAVGQLVMALLAVGLAAVMEAAGLIPGPVVPGLRDAFGSSRYSSVWLAGLYLATVGLGWLALERRRIRGLYGPGDLKPARAKISTAGRLLLRRHR